MKTRAIKINMGHEPIITSEQETNQHYSPACSFLLDHKLPIFAAANLTWLLVHGCLLLSNSFLHISIVRNGWGMRGR